MKHLRKIAITGVAALAIVSGISFAPTQSHAAGRLLGAAIVGAVVGGAIANRRNRNYQGTHSDYTPPAYYQPACFWTTQTRYDAYNQPYAARVKVCQ